MVIFRSLLRTEQVGDDDETMIGSQDSQKSVCDQTINIGEGNTSPSFGNQGPKTPKGNSIVGEISLGLDNVITPGTTPVQDNDDDDLNRLAAEAAQKAELFAPSPDTNSAKKFSFEQKLILRGNIENLSDAQKMTVWAILRVWPLGRVPM